ncbi:hypothetical protein ACF5W4_05075 [Bacillota bacterium Lsc_1132]
MDKAVIFGAFEFIGFYFCKKMLEMGYEVEGIHFDKEQDGYTEEKRLEVGRNANFQEQTIMEWLKSELQSSEKQTFILNLFDLFMGYKDSILENHQLAEQLADFFSKRNHLNDKIVSVLPIQLLADRSKHVSIERLQHFLEKITVSSEKWQYFYLPTVYGPWQPSTYCFQKSIEDKIDERKETEDREWTKDALYVDDLLETMLGIIEEGKPGHYLLESGETERWKECAALLHLDEEQQEENQWPDIRLDKHVLRVALPKLTSVSESLAKQKQHLSRMRQ